MKVPHSQSDWWWMHAKQNSCAMSKTARSTLEGKNHECVTNFEYLGSWISTTSRDIASHKAKTWPVLHKLDKIWKFNLPRWLKMWFFRAVAGSILLYGAESWTLVKAYELKLDESYMWILCFALNEHWSQHVNKWTIICWSALFKCHDQALLHEICRSLLLSWGGINIQSSLLDATAWKKKVW